MPIALEMWGIRKRFVAGAGSCRASADVLRGVDLVVREGESVAVVGANGAGKSTLMLCAAGLMTPDQGERRWFGDMSRSAAVRRSLYHMNAGDMSRDGSIDERHLHLVDIDVDVAKANDVAVMEQWVRKRCDTGDAVLVAARDESVARRVASRVFLLRHGLLHLLSPPQARVAEFVDRSFQRV